MNRLLEIDSKCPEYSDDVQYLLNAISLGMGLIGVLAICSYLRIAGEHLWSFLAVPLLTLGHGAFIYHEGWAAMIAPAIGAGASGEGVFEALTPGVPGTEPSVALYGWLVLYWVGWICLLVAIWRSHVLSRVMTWTVLVAYLAQSVPPPAWIAPQYKLLVLSALVHWPIAYQMWVDSTKPAVADRPAQA